MTNKPTRRLAKVTGYEAALPIRFSLLTPNAILQFPPAPESKLARRGAFGAATHHERA